MVAMRCDLVDEEVAKAYLPIMIRREKGKANLHDVKCGEILSLWQGRLAVLRS